MVVADLPDPNHPDLNRLNIDYFYARIKQLLSPDGAFVTQSPPLLHATNAFLSIGKTLTHASFHAENTAPTCPASASGAGASARSRANPPPHASPNIATIPDGWLTPTQLTAAFAFAKGFFKGRTRWR